MTGEQFPRRQAGEARQLARALWRQTRVTVRRTPGLLALSLVLAVVLWIFVTDEENPTRTDVFPTRVPVAAVNVGAQLAVANVLSSVDVRLSAPEDSWEQLTIANFRAIVDLNGLDGRAQDVRVSVEVAGVRGVRVLDVIPSEIVVNLEDFVSREVSVATRLVGTLPRGYELDQAIPDRLTVEMSGPESLVALVDEAVADVNVTGLTVPITPSVQLVARTEVGGEIRGVFIDPPAVRVDVQVVQSTLRRTLPLEVEVAGNPATGYRIDTIEILPSTVNVEGVFEALQEIDALSLERINVDGASETVRVSLPIVPPDGIVSVSQPRAEVVISIVPATGTVVVSVAPTIVNLADGLELTLDPGFGSVEVVIEGQLPVISLLGPDDVEVFANATALSAADARNGGAVTVPVSAGEVAGGLVIEVRPEVLSGTLVAP